MAIAVENALAFQQIDELKNKLAKEKLYLEDEIRTEFNFDEIVGQSAGAAPHPRNKSKLSPRQTPPF